MKASDAKRKIDSTEYLHKKNWKNLIQEINNIPESSRTKKNYDHTKVE